MSYRPRRIETMGVDRTDGVRVKRYGIALGIPLPRPEVLSAGRETTRRSLADASPLHGVAFSIAHQGKGSCGYLTCWFDEDANVHTRIWLAPLSAPSSVRTAPATQGPDVWELAPVWYERDAWVRHVLDPKDPDLDGYLDDAYRGEA